MAQSGSASVPKAADMVPIHYVWIGPPPDRYSKHPGHDTDGPLAMEVRNKMNPIHFWCLDEYVDHYQKVFKDKNIIAYGVQHELKEMKSDGIADSKSAVAIQDTAAAPQK